MYFRISNVLLLGGIFLFALCKSSSTQHSSSQPLAPITPMPTQNLNAPPGDYAEAWKRIDSLENQGLYKSALEAAEELQKRARADNNDAQVVKTLLYRGKYITQLQEDGFVKAVALLEEELKASSGAEAAVLHSLLGQLYSTYLDNQYWQIRDRTDVVNDDSNDMLTWSVEKIEQVSMDHYEASIEDPDFLRKVAVDQFKDITTKGRNDTIGTPLRPTLLDLLGHRALDHYANERRYLSEPVYAFVLDDEVAFAAVNAFTEARFSTRDSSSRKWRALKAFQKILIAHQNDADPSALIDADLKRLNFVRNTSVDPEKDTRYQGAIEDLYNKYKAHPASADVAYVLGLFYHQQDKEKHPDKTVKALEILGKAVKDHPNTFGARHAEALIREIKRKTLYITLEDVNIPKKPALVLVEYKNITSLNLWAYRLPMDGSDPTEQMGAGQLLEWVQGQKAVSQRTWALPEYSDYLQHSTEVMLEGLPPGKYLIAAAPDKKMDRSNPIAFARVQHSSIMPVLLGEKNQTHIFTTDRSVGTPLENVQIDFFERNWDRKSRDYVTNLVKTEKTDKEGKCTPGVGRQGGLMVRYRMGEDTLWYGNFYHNNGYGQRYEYEEAHFFTDRSLYRPGQSVYFKAVLIRRDKDGIPQIIPNKKVSAVFYDANSQKVAELKLRSNEYGTINGVFTAPAAGLTGQMRIEIMDFSGGAYFNVEEYKRPKFEVDFEPVKEAIRLNDAVTVVGTARAYAGSAVDGATVRYRVVRRTFFPYWRWYDSYYPPYGGEEQEIAFGSTTTRADGTFDVPFKALPDRSVPEERKPTFSYTITADVTDINGETRSGTSSVTIGYVALNASLDVPDRINLDSLGNIRIKTENWAGEAQKAAGSIVVQSLKKPAPFFHKRLWQNPDTTILGSAMFKKYFERFAWKDEENPDTWEHKSRAKSYDFDTDKQKQIDLSAAAAEIGSYRLTLKTKDAYGTEVEWSKVVEVWHDSQPQTRFGTPEAQAITPSVTPGNMAKVRFGAPLPECYWYIYREQDGVLVNPRWQISDPAKDLEYSVSEQDRGGIPIGGFLVYDNRFYSTSRLIQVPWDNKDLQISYETFRDKLKPGDQEVWRLKISGQVRKK
jgi:tetratricopeptide (TPR) repeat protein